MEYINKSVLVTGGTGMIGIPLVKKLVEQGAFVYVASLDDNKNRKVEGATYYKPEESDLTDIKNCLRVSKDVDFVFHLAGIKGSPKMSKEKPANFFVPVLMFNTNMMEAARRNGVKRYLYTSSVGVYNKSPDGIFHEDDVWKTMPSEHDWYPGWAKRIGELQSEVYMIQYPEFGKNIRIVRPANVYGPFDNFDSENAMVIPSLINKALNNSILEVWGSGKPIRDFIYSDDVADGILKVFESGCTAPVNIGSGKRISIGAIAETIGALCGKSLVWDITKPDGDPIRLMDTDRAKKLGFEATTSLEVGLSKTIEWYKKYGKTDTRYNIFKDKK